MKGSQQCSSSVVAVAVSYYGSIGRGSIVYHRYLTGTVGRNIVSGS